jgi:glycosyltransferase involved in cell wall biosynthesis
MFQSARKLHKATKFSMVHCRSYISALAGLHLKRKFGVKFIFDMRGFWADERVEGDIWKLKNPLFKLIYNFFKKQENNYLFASNYTISLTETGKNEIHSWPQLKQNPIPIEVIPCCADFDHFRQSEGQNIRTQELQEEFGISNTNFILSYLGSVGTWYMLDEMIDFFKVLQIQKPQAKFLFISPDSEEMIKEVAAKRGVDPSGIMVKPASRADVPAFIALSTVSLFFIKPVYSKKASSPTKMAEIMGMGIPIICNTNVGDVEQIINETRVGIAIKEFTETAYNEAIDQLDALLKIDPAKIRQCAIDRFSLESGVEKYNGVYRKVLGLD